MPNWMKHKMESRLPGEISITSDMQMIPHSRKQRRTKSLLMKVKEETENVSLKLNTQKTKIMASSLIASLQIEGGKVASVTNFLFLDSKIIQHGDCSHEIKRCLLLGRKAMTNIDCIKKQRHHSDDKGLYSHNYGFLSSYVQM